jgi:hypothetical protein
LYRRNHIKRLVNLLLKIFTFPLIVATLLIFIAFAHFGSPLFTAILTIVYRGARETAANPETTSETLRTLSRSFDRETRKAVAGNPNTPNNCLWELVKEFPHEIINNPVFPLITLENPEWILDITDTALIELLKQPKIPEIFLREAARKTKYLPESVLVALLANPDTSIDLVEEITLYHQTLYEDVLNHPNLTLASLERFMTQGNWEMQSELVDHFFSPPRHLLKRLSTSNSAEEAVQQLIDNGSSQFRRQLLSHATLPPKYIPTLIKDLSWTEKLNIARQESYVPDVLAYLANLPIVDKKFQIQMHQTLARNRFTPIVILDELADSKYVAVRANVSLNPHLPKDIIIKLALDPHKTVRKYLQYNRELPIHFIQELTTHSNQRIRQLAIHLLNRENALHD